MKLLIDWLKKKLGYHVCEEFTQWEDKSANFSREPKESDGFAFYEDRAITYTERWQERRCTTCGLIEQRELER